MSAPPAPLVPAGVDLRGFPFTPIYRGKLFGSSFHARVSDAGWRAGVTLWLKSWDQVPAGTLPGDEVELCRLAEFARDVKAWRKVASEALHGWFMCSDGRLHHRTVAEGVMDAWHRKIAQRDRTEGARKARLAKRQSQTQGAMPTDSVTGSVTEPVTDPVTGSKGQGQGQGHIPPEPPSGSLPLKADRARGTRIAADWALDDAGRSYALGQGLTPAEVDTEATKFRDWWSAKAGADARKVDWAATWRTWVRNAVERRGRPITVQSGFGGRPGAPNGAGPVRSTSGPSSARAGIALGLNPYRGEPL